MTATTQSGSGQAGHNAGSGVAAPISRRWAAFAFVASSIVTAGLAVGGGWVSHHYEQQQDKRQEDYKAFQLSADKLDPLFRDFVPTYLETAPVDRQGRPRTQRAMDSALLVTRIDAIQDNILEQITLLERIEMGVKEADVATIRQYRDRLIALDAVLDDLPPVDQSPSTMKAIERARVARISVLDALRQRANSLVY